MKVESVSVLGATGSIGEQTIEILRLFSERFRVECLTAHRNWRRLAEQARELLPRSVVIGDEEFYDVLREELKDLPIEVLAGEKAVAAAGEAGDVVVNALVGYAGLAPTVAALRAGRKLALANKESLVVAGELVMGLAASGAARGAAIVPIDSEHSAVLQCLAGEASEPRRIILTASGGALRDVPLERLGEMKAADALKHPNWSMGRKITIDSATMVNKGFEVIEARWLFGLPSERIDVLIHPQSVVHSMVEFADGAVKAQMGTPDMRVPIAYALAAPERLTLPTGPLKFGEMTFSQVDGARYPALGIARECLAAGGTSACALNAANEVAVEAFLEGRIGFLDIVRTIERVLERTENIAAPGLEDYAAADAHARELWRRL